MNLTALSRREALIAGAAGTLLSATAATAGEPAGSGHGSHDGGGHAGMRHKALFATAMDCVGKAEICTPHCLDLISKGDTKLAECLSSVQQMLPACVALARYAALDAPRLKELAQFCIGVCEDCEKACRKHEQHEVCRSCAESCAACAKECKSLIKA
jgi:Cys-rich four helix bundle protein (predicted Tat secretion target)